MKTLFYFTYLLCFTINVNICTKNLYDADVKLSRELRSHPVKRNEQSYDQRTGDSSIIRLNNEQDNGDRLRGSRIVKRSLEEQSKEPYGLVYRKGRLLGILEPLSEFYGLSPYSNMNEAADEEIEYLPNRMASLTDQVDDSEKDESSQNEYVQYANDKYPKVLTSFKIDKKLNALNEKKREKMDKLSARDKYGLSIDDKAVDKKSIRKYANLEEENSPDKVDAIEDDLRKILDDIGLIERGKQENLEKRDINNEDENLEEGSNKINVVKATHDPENADRKKREEEFNGKSTASSVSEVKNDQENKREVSLSNVQNYQAEGEAFVRNKRNEGIKENNDIMKGLEKSGELTVSGNKSPLASSENESKTTEKRKNSESTNIDDYERLLEKNIQQKINLIKEEVKREIAVLQAKGAFEAKTVDDSQRRKREATKTLIEKELESLNPQENPEGPLVTYIRRKRHSENPKRSRRHLEEFGRYRNNDYFANTNNFDEDANDDYSFKEKRSLNMLVSISSTISDGLTEKKIENQEEISKIDGTDLSSKNSDKRQTQTDSALVDDLKMQQKRHIDFSQSTPISVSHLRKKRGEAVMPDGNVAYLPYKGEDDEIDEEADEFDDDGFDDRSAGVHKRDIQDYEEEVNNGYGVDQIEANPSRKFIGNLNSDVYEHSLQNNLANNYLSYDPSAYIRKKRNNFDQLVALHGGGPMLHHLSAVRERNMRQLKNEARPRRNYRSPLKIVENNEVAQQNIADLSGTDLFGALPQSYEGELSRFKRVKRNAAKGTRLT